VSSANSAGEHWRSVDKGVTVVFIAVPEPDKKAENEEIETIIRRNYSDAALLHILA
jgi:vacuolar-type H+-ATPase subunit F/Vma7